MTDYTTLSNTAVGVGGLPSGATVTALRDNPIAIAEGAVGAPRVLDAALDATVTTAGIDWVMNRTAGATAGAVGVYSFLFNATKGQSIIAGTNYAGSSLRYTGIRATANLVTNLSGVNVVSSGASSTQSGTWKAMSTAGNVTDYFAATLFLRIA